jgi:hypothetical protein
VPLLLPIGVFMRFKHSFNNGEIEIRDEETGVITWHGRPMGFQVKKIIQTFENGECIVLLDRDCWPKRPFANLVKINFNGNLLWSAQLPPIGGNDVYVDASWTKGELSANSWSCYRTIIDPETGKIQSSEFTK